MRKKFIRYGCDAAGYHAGYGHQFRWRGFTVTVLGSPTLADAQAVLPFRFLSWKLVDAGPHYGVFNVFPSEKRK